MRRAWRSQDPLRGAQPRRADHLPSGLRALQGHPGDEEAAHPARLQADLEKYLLPKLGKKKQPDITYEHVTGITDGLSPSEGAHCLAVGRTFFRWCVTGNAPA